MICLAGGSGLFLNSKYQGEWFESLQIEVAASILPPLVSMSWEIRNLSMCKIVECALDFSLLKVNSFANIF